MSRKNFSPYVPRPATLVRKERLSDLVTPVSYTHLRAHET